MTQTRALILSVRRVPIFKVQIDASVCHGGPAAAACEPPDSEPEPEPESDSEFPEPESDSEKVTFSSAASDSDSDSDSDDDLLFLSHRARA